MKHTNKGPAFTATAIKVDGITIRTIVTFDARRDLVTFIANHCTIAHLAARLDARDASGPSCPASDYYADDVIAIGTESDHFVAALRAAHAARLAAVIRCSRRADKGGPRAAGWARQATEAARAVATIAERIARCDAAAARYAALCASEVGA